MHWKGMHLTFCCAALELAWQKGVLETLRVVPGARWPFSPTRLSAFLCFSLPLSWAVLPRMLESAKGRTNMELREKFILADGASQGMAAFRPRGRRSRPSSRGASPNRSTSVSSQAGQAATPPVPATSTPKVGPLPPPIPTSAKARFSGCGDPRICRTSFLQMCFFP